MNKSFEGLRAAMALGGYVAEPVQDRGIPWIRVTRLDGKSKLFTEQGAKELAKRCERNFALRLGHVICGGNKA